ncbi:hypothetical protein SERLADRAFT_459465 [Serpula lacrymans var. lacrymans S7.9]|uniref:Uncharacterized protein n=1 Tax=Serpula lacrymans var. lacrymans (strain S7.9) TaxID=578457 RepID=F8NK41_SERL9|nr:uncharacterized protein SERLADRAFT_459465 [Serpula lacrymans var. lacrymans S7.9]EGO28725.1 hypothetical protein SERLADRAFT_459465 [Serpula lacrymans var. lacrymans S7.9]
MCITSFCWPILSSVIYGFHKDKVILEFWCVISPKSHTLVSPEICVVTYVLEFFRTQCHLNPALQLTGIMHSSNRVQLDYHTKGIPSKKSYDISLPEASAM